MKNLFKIFSVAALLVVVATSSANAQIYYGVKAGANVSLLSAISSEMGDAKSEYGYQAGVTLGAKIPIVGIGVEAEALWINNKMSLASFGSIESNSFEIPVMVSVPIVPLLPIFVKAGPTFTIYNEATMESDYAGSYSLGQIKGNIGYTAGIGVNLFKFSLDVRYNGEFSDSTMSLVENATKATATDALSTAYDMKTSTVSVTLGYRF